jgi:hypothetical protein
MSRQISIEHLAKKSKLFEIEHRQNAHMELRKAIRMLEMVPPQYDQASDRIIEATKSMHLALACHQIQDLIESMEEQ